MADTLSRNSKYWQDNGSLIVHVENESYKLDPTVLDNISSRFASLPRESTELLPLVKLEDIASSDFQALLEHVYNDIPLETDPSFSRLASILRVTSERQLDIPSINAAARQKLLEIFPKGLEDLVQYPDAPDEALTLAVEYNLLPIQKALYYRVATHMHLHEEEPNGDATGDEAQSRDTTHQDPSTIANLPPELRQRCKTLLDQLIDHFTPILFTVATAGHMACTDVFAETWMPVVIGPALETSGLCKPIETLQTIMDIDWKSHGLCDECVKEKREEWRGEQEVIWKKMNEWLGLEA
ncbi:hypothetical protein K474DRAFT_125858 [Panus rudis PR-1116 ss-1]|nr:hypothetical protein K474DRAFT_125858 [Panus rudis PR-1116 ss-1]